MSISSFSPGFGVAKPQAYPAFAPTRSAKLSVPSYDAGTSLDSGLQSPTGLDSQSLGGGNAIQGLGDGSISTILQAVLGMVVTLLSALTGMLGGGSAAQDPANAADGSTAANPDTTTNPDASNGGSADASSGGGGGCHGHHGSHSGNVPPSQPDPGASGPDPGTNTHPNSGTKPQGSGNGNAEQQQFLQLINNFRAQNGLNPVKLNDKLDQTAMDYAKAMNDSGQMTHTLNGTSFDQRMKDHGYNMGTGTENIAAGQQSVQEAFDAWCSDKGHRDNLLNPGVTEIGLGHVGSYWDQEGAAPL